MKRIFLLFVLSLLVACPTVPADPAPAEPAADAGGALSPHSVPPPTGTGLVTVTANKQNPTALAAGANGNLLTSNGTAWISQAPSSANFVTLWSPAGMGATNHGDWTTGNFTAGRSVAVMNQSVVVTGVKFWAQWAGGGSRTIKVRLCTATTQASGGANVSVATASASIASGTLATISFSSPQTLIPTIATGWMVTTYDTTAAAYARAPSPSFVSAVDQPTFWYADATGHQIWIGTSRYASGDNCPNTLGGTGFGDEFYEVEPVIQ